MLSGTVWLRTIEYHLYACYVSKMVAARFFTAFALFVFMFSVSVLSDYHQLRNKDFKYL